MLEGAPCIAPVVASFASRCVALVLGGVAAAERIVEIIVEENTKTTDDTVES